MHVSMRLPWVEALLVLIVAGWLEPSQAERPSSNAHGDPSSVVLQLRSTGSLSVRQPSNESSSDSAQESLNAPVGQAPAPGISLAGPVGQAPATPFDSREDPVGQGPAPATPYDTEEDSGKPVDVHNHFPNVDRWRLKFDGRVDGLKKHIQNTLTDKAVTAIGKSDDYTKMPVNIHEGLEKMHNSMGSMRNQIQDEENKETADLGDLLKKAQSHAAVPDVPDEFNLPGQSGLQVPDGDMMVNMANLQEENAALKKQLAELRAADAGGAPTLAGTAEKLATEAHDLAQEAKDEEDEHAVPAAAAEAAAAPSPTVPAAVAEAAVAPAPATGAAAAAMVAPAPGLPPPIE